MQSFAEYRLETLPRFSLLVQEVPLDAIQNAAREPGRRHDTAGNHPHVCGEDRPSPVLDGAVGEKPFDASRQAGEHISQPLERLLARALGREISRTALEHTIEHLVDDQPPVEHRGECLSQPSFTKLGKEQAHVLIAAREAAADVERAVERLFHQSRHLCFVSHFEAGIEIGFERKLAKQRQAERIDGADRDVARPLPQIAPQPLDRGRETPTRLLSSLRIRPRISAAALRVNVIARMFPGSTPRLNRLR